MGWGQYWTAIPSHPLYTFWELKLGPGKGLGRLGPEALDTGAWGDGALELTGPRPNGIESLLLTA